MARNRIVKVRVTEAEYSDWVQQATEASVSLSEAIRRAMEPGSRSGTIFVGEALTVTPGGNASSAAPIVLDWRPKEVTGIAPEEPGRRSIPCIHDRPAYAFCPECDGK